MTWPFSIKGFRTARSAGKLEGSQTCRIPPSFRLHSKGLTRKKCKGRRRLTDMSDRATLESAEHVAVVSGGDRAESRLQMWDVRVTYWT